MFPDAEKAALFMDEESPVRLATLGWGAWFLVDFEPSSEVLPEEDKVIRSNLEIMEIMADCVLMPTVPPQPPELPSIHFSPVSQGKRARSSLGTFGIVVAVVAVVTIAGLAVVATVILPNIRRIDEAARQAHEVRNAQNLASVCASAKMGGINFVELGGNDLMGTLRAIRTGVVADNPGNPFYGIFFGTPNLTEEDLAAASKHLDLSDGRIILATTSPFARQEASQKDQAAMRELEARILAKVKNESTSPVAENSAVVEREKNAKAFAKMMADLFEAGRRKGLDFLAMAEGDLVKATRLLTENVTTGAREKGNPDFAVRFESEVMEVGPDFDIVLSHLEVSDGRVFFLEERVPDKTELSEN